MHVTPKPDTHVCMQALMGVHNLDLLRACAQAVSGAHAHKRSLVRMLSPNVWCARTQEILSARAKEISSCVHAYERAILRPHDADLLRTCT